MWGAYMKKRFQLSVSVLVAAMVPALAGIAAVGYGLASPGSGQAAATQAGPPRLEDGTPLKLRLKQTISSADAHVNNEVNFDVLEEVRVNDLVVIPKGSLALGTVTEAKPKGRMGHGGKLNVNIDSVRLADGEKAALRGVKDTQGGGHTGAMTAGIVATSLIIWPAAPFFLFMHGKDITIPEGTEITAFINGDVPIDLAKFGGQVKAAAQGQAAPVVEQPAQSVPAAPPIELSPVAVKSIPDGADITVDGSYMGSTPSIVRLKPGDHTIAVSKNGYKTWQRTVTVNAYSNITIDATLDAAQ